MVRTFEVFLGVLLILLNFILSPRFDVASLSVALLTKFDLIVVVV